MLRSDNGTASVQIQWKKNYHLVHTDFGVTINYSKADTERIF